MTTATPQTVSKSRVLIIDDERNICSLLAGVLKSKHTVETALCAADALAFVKQNDYDLLVTDLRLPDGNGIDILREVKSKDAGTEVIILTAYASVDTAITAINLGASSYLTKPVSLANFVAQVDKSLANREFHLRSRRLMDTTFKQDGAARDHFTNITLIYELSRKLMLFLDVGDIMRTILRELNDRLGASVCAVGVNLYGRADLFAMPRIAAAARESVGALITDRWEETFGMLDKKEFSKEHVAVTLFDCTGGAAVETSMLAPIVIPMIVMGRTIGCIVIFREQSRPLSMAEYQFVHVFSSLASPLVENCYVHQRTKLLAATDGLTGVANHRAFHEMLAREIARADRDRNEFCLCIMDIDDFKKVNDTFGHLTGDAVLRDVCGRIAAAIREVDILARYGGEEFALILPSTSIDGALKLSERILGEVASRPFPLPGQGISYTISIGVASYHGERPRKKEQLIRDADAALYASKANGKNRVTAHQED